MTTFPGHVAGAYLALEIINAIDPSLHLGLSHILFAGIVAGIAPDIDAPFYIGRMRDHHDTPTHTPSFWLVILLLACVLNRIFQVMPTAYILAIFIGVASHLF